MNEIRIRRKEREENKDNDEENEKSEKKGKGRKMVKGMGNAWEKNGNDRKEKELKKGTKISNCRD